MTVEPSDALRRPVAKLCAACPIESEVNRYLSSMTDALGSEDCENKCGSMLHLLDDCMCLERVVDEPGHITIHGCINHAPISDNCAISSDCHHIAVNTTSIVGSLTPVRHNNRHNN